MKLAIRVLWISFVFIATIMSFDLIIKKSRTGIKSTNKESPFDDVKVTVTQGKTILLHVSAFDAQYQFIAEPNQPIYVSNDYGKTWNFTAGLIKNWDTKMGEISFGGIGMIIFTKEGEMYISDDYGKNWKLHK